MSDQLTCQRPDRDAPKLVCGYPLPCPHHTEVLDGRVRLQFMVDPQALADKAFVPDAVKVKIIDPEAIFLTGLLGESGRKLVSAGILFYFEGKLARNLIAKGIAEEVSDG